MPQNRRQATSRLAQASRVQVTHQSSSPSHCQCPGILRLRGEERLSTGNTDDEGPPARHIRWSEDVVDNEGMGKKSSKVCCIYHKSRPVDESSSESDSSESEDSSRADSDNEPDDQGYSSVNCSRHDHTQNGKPSNGCLSGRASREERLSDSLKSDNDKAKRRKPSPNAYEKMPKATKAHPKGSGL